MTMNMLKSDLSPLLLLLPHEDDEVFCAGTLSRILRSGGVVSVQTITRRSGKDRRIQSNGEYKFYDSSDRSLEFSNSMHLLGKIGKLSVFDPLYVGDEQHRLDMVSRMDLVNRIESIVRHVSPAVIMLPAPSYDQDHVAVFDAVQSVMRPHFYGGSVLSYPVFREPLFTPHLFVRLEDQDVMVRQNAANCYKTQQSSELHLISPETQMNTMTYFGRMVFSQWAEAFEVHRLAL